MAGLWLPADVEVVFVEVEVSFGELAKFTARFITVLTVAFVLAACGEDRTGSIPQATDPNAGQGGNLPGFGNRSTSIPNLPNGVEINLFNVSTYAGAEDILKPTHYLVPPVILSKVQMNLKSNTGSSVAEKVWILIEDQDQGFVAEIPVVSAVTIRNSSSIDMTFSDNYLTVRIRGTISSGTLSGTIYYRNRVGSWSGSTWVPSEWQCIPRSNSSLTIGAECRDGYMSTSNSSVKSLGTFVKTSFSSWAQ